MNHPNSRNHSDGTDNRCSIRSSRTARKIVNLGPKQIYVYKDLKVTFVRGKVVDVQ
jgi:hypothetical protein